MQGTKKTRVPIVLRYQLDNGQLMMPMGGGKEWAVGEEFTWEEGDKTMTARIAEVFGPDVDIAEFLKARKEQSKNQKLCNSTTV